MFMKSLFYFILILAIIGGLYFGSVILIKDLRSGRAETMSQKYVENLYKEYSIIGQNCQGEDTNGDSYVSCDIRIQVGNATETSKVLQLSCPTMWKSYTGNTCKESRLALPVQG